MNEFITKYYQQLFDHMVDNYRLHLHISEMDDLVSLVKKMECSDFPLLADVTAAEWSIVVDALQNYRLQLGDKYYLTRKAIKEVLEKLTGVKDNII